MNILMPQLGETVAEGKITKWFKSAGDAVKPGDNLFEIETDKVSMEVPATEAGVLSEIRVQEGETAPVGAIVGVIGGAAAGLGIQMQPARPASEAPHADFAEHAGLRRRHFHRHLVGLDLEQIVAGSNGVAGRFEPLGDLAFGDRLAELRHEDVHDLLGIAFR